MLWLLVSWHQGVCLVALGLVSGLLFAPRLVTRWDLTRDSIRDTALHVTSVTRQLSHCHGRLSSPSDLVTRPVSNWVWHLGPDVTTGISLMSPSLMSDTSSSCISITRQVSSQDTAPLGWTGAFLPLLNWIERFYHRNYFYEFWLGFDPLITIDSWLKLANSQRRMICVMLAIRGIPGMPTQSPWVRLCKLPGSNLSDVICLLCSLQ